MTGLSAKWNVDIYPRTLFVILHNTANVSVNLLFVMHPSFLCHRLFTMCAIIGILQMCPLHAQDTVRVSITGAAPEKLSPLPDHTLVFQDVTAANQFARSILQEWHLNGYLLAFSELQPLTDSTANIYFEHGPQLQWAELKIAPEDLPFAQIAGLSKEFTEGRKFNYTDYTRALRSLVQALNNKGYPFAYVSCQSWQLQENTLTAELHIDRNTFFTFDSVILVGNLNISQNYLNAYTGIKPGEPYNQSIIDALPVRLRQLGFAQMVKEPVVEFVGNQARVIIFAETRKTSRFDFILGVLPDNAITGRLVITGDIQLQLQNTFGQGESLQFQYTKLESSTKSLLAKAAYPFLPGLPFGPEGMFYLYLKDSTFLERKSDFGLVYQLSGTDKLKGLVRFAQSSVLRPDTTFALNNFELPAMLDVKETTYGFEWSSQRVNDIFNPKKGWIWNVSASAGTRTILENASIAGLTNPEFPDYNYASLYDSIDTKTFSGRYQLDIQYFQPLGKNSTLLFQLRGAALLQPEPVANELMRIGGANLLRGFDEQSLPVANYHMGTLEYRYLLGARSFMSVFSDVGYVQNPTILTSEFWVYGFGAGIRFESKAGIFGLTYALGGTSEAPVQFRNTKVHFGYINYF